jgi:hypothetical protein
VPKIFSKLVIYPILFAIYPIFFLFSNNQNELRLDVIWIPILISLILVVVIWLLSWVVFRNLRKAALFTTLITVLFLSYGHLIKLISKFEPYISTMAYIKNDKVLFSLIFSTVALAALCLLNSKRKLTSLHLYLNVFTVVFSLLQVVKIVQTENNIQKDLKRLDIKQSMNESVATDTPDIYYIVLDMYGRKDVLQNTFDYDNSEFERELSSLGFNVLENANSNYAHTYLSLTSSLNMEHVNTLEETLGKSGWSDGVIYEWMHNSKAMAFARDNGYKLINFQSGFGPTDDLKIADINYRIGNILPLLQLFNKDITLTAFDLQYLRSTMLSPVLEKHFLRSIRSQFLYTFKMMSEDIPRDREKTFTLAHMVLPHPPYMFDEFGNEIPKAELEAAGEPFLDKKNYIRQLRFTSDKTLETVKNILKRSKTPPIIIIQSDHGPCTILGHPHGWPRPAPEEGIAERMAIINAIYLPDSPDILYEGITPVNTFKVIYNHYFDADFKLDEDTIYYTDFVNMLEFFDVTDQVK